MDMVIQGIMISPALLQGTLLLVLFFHSISFLSLSSLCDTKSTAGSFIVCYFETLFRFNTYFCHVFFNGRNLHVVTRTRGIKHVALFLYKRMEIIAYRSCTFKTKMKLAKFHIRLFKCSSVSSHIVCQYLFSVIVTRGLQNQIPR